MEKSSAFGAFEMIVFVTARRITGKLEAGAFTLATEIFSDSSVFAELVKMPVNRGFADGFTFLAERKKNLVRREMPVGIFSQEVCDKLTLSCLIAQNLHRRTINLKTVFIFSFYILTQAPVFVNSGYAVIFHFSQMLCFAKI